MPKIIPHLWFDHQAEEAAKFYVSIFPNSKITDTARYTEAGHEQHKMEPGSVMTIAFELDGQQFLALNGGPLFQFSPAVSFLISCADQAEIDHYWDALTAGGDPKAQQCGWLADKFGVSWQVTPSRLGELMTSDDPAVVQRVTEAFMKMKKIDIAELDRAAQG